MRDFQVLFDHGEHSELPDPVYAAYGELGFPAAPADRPWIFANFVQTLDGIVSLLGTQASGSDLSQSPEDRWLMDLLRAHADAVLIGMGTLRVETALGRPGPRGPVFRIADPAIRGLREKLHRGPERNILLTGSDIQFDRYAVFDGNGVEPFLLTTSGVANKLSLQMRQRPQVRVIVCGDGQRVDLKQAVCLLRRQFGIRYLLCEGGPISYSNMLELDLIDEKFLTVAPIEVGLHMPQSEAAPDSSAIRPTAFVGGGLSRENAVYWEWLSCRKVGDHQFHRLRRKREKR